MQFKFIVDRRSYIETVLKTIELTKQKENRQPEYEDIPTRANVKKIFRNEKQKSFILTKIIFCPATAGWKGMQQDTIQK